MSDLSSLQGRELERGGNSNTSIGKKNQNHSSETNLFTHLPIHLFTSKKLAFTLAEVLITLGIIGVVAALTLPNLIQEYQKKVAVSAAKKAYSIISQAYSLVLNNNEDGLGVCYTNDSRCLGELFSPVLKALNGKLYIPDSEKAEGCWEDNDIGMSNETHYCISAVDGISYDFDMEFQNKNFRQAIVYIDVNGTKYPNVFGRDRFAFFIMESRVVPAKLFSSIDESGYYNAKATCNYGKKFGDRSFYSNIGCAYEYIYGEKIN